MFRRRLEGGEAEREAGAASVALWLGWMTCGLAALVAAPGCAHEGESEGGEERVVAESTLAEVLVARGALEAGDALGEEAVRFERMPAELVRPEMITRAEWEGYRGDRLEVAIGADGLVLERDIAPQTESAAGRRAPLVVSDDRAEQRTVGGGKARIWKYVTGEEAFLGKMQIAPGASVPEHRDPTEELLYILEGGGTISIDGTEYPIGPNTAVYMPADARVSYVNGEEVTVAVQIFAGPGPAEKYEAWDPVEPADEAGR
jgi:quercetin dioxygenase-like cupin family protein